jgi:hypothetical protein
MYDPSANFERQALIERLIKSNRLIQEVIEENHPLNELLDLSEGLVQRMEGIASELDSCFDESKIKELKKEGRELSQVLLEVSNMLKKFTE